MSVTRTIAVAATITALSSLALPLASPLASPAHAGDGNQSGQAGGDALNVVTVTTADCEAGGLGQVVANETSLTGERCLGGPFNGHVVSDVPL